MSLKCLSESCSDYELANAQQLEFIQDNQSGWNLSLGRQFKVAQSSLPQSIRLIDSNDPKFPHSVICNRCMAKVGKVNKVPGNRDMTVNFAAKHSMLLAPGTVAEYPATPARKWSKFVDLFPQIHQHKLRYTAPRNPQIVPVVSSDTKHYDMDSDLKLLCANGKSVAASFNLNPNNFQWRSYFFACLNNVSYIVVGLNRNETGLLIFLDIAVHAIWYGENVDRKYARERLSKSKPGEGNRIRCTSFRNGELRNLFRNLPLNIFLIRSTTKLTS